MRCFERVILLTKLIQKEGQEVYGRVTKYFHDKGYGFIKGEDDNSYFIHASKLYGEYIDRGYYVFFKPYADDRSDFNAKNVNVIEVPETKRR